jgi:hypothetical protein
MVLPTETTASLIEFQRIFNGWNRSRAASQDSAFQERRVIEPATGNPVSRVGRRLPRWLRRAFSY